MAIDTIKPRSRRALLAAAVGGAAAAVAASVAKVAPTEAADGGNMLIGRENRASSMTTIFKQTGWGTAFQAAVGGTGTAIFASGDTGITAAGSTGVDAFSAAGHGLRVRSGRIKIDQVSGVATIKKGRRSVNVTPSVPVNAKTFVLLTPMSNIGSRGVWFTRSPAASRFTIRMTSARSGPTKIAWLALERG